MALGIPRDEMLARMSSAELTEWMGFAQVEPFGRRADDFAQAITSSVIANVNRKQGTKAHKVDVFMPNYEAKTQTPEQMVQLAEMYTVGLGGQDERPESDG